MAVLTAKRRRSLPSSAFVYPKTRAYPIHDRKHARAALSLSARKDTKGSYATVRKAVAKKYPGMISGTTTKRSAGSRRRRRSSSRSSRSRSR